MIDWERGIETCDFWIGEFPNWDVFSDYVGEDPRYYELIDTKDQVPRSRFVHDQGQYHYDSVMEMVFRPNARSVAELVEACSYADQYAGELARRANNNIGLSGANAFLFIRGGEIMNPRSVTKENFKILYVGKITYKI